jgi:predicted phage tail protein
MVRESLERIVEVIDRREGRRGDALEKSVTWGDLTTLGVVEQTTPVAGTSPSNYRRVESTPLLNCPRAGSIVPFNLKGKSGLTVVFLTWEVEPDCRIGAFEVYRAEADDLATAGLIGTVFGTGFTDRDVLLPTFEERQADPNAGTYYYWVRSVDLSGKASAFNSPGGLRVQLGVAIGDIVDALQDQVTRTMLDSDIGGKVDLIGDPALGATAGQQPGTLLAGLYEQSVATETLRSDTQQLVGQTVTDLTGKINTASTTLTNKIEVVDGKLDAQYTLRVDNTGPSGQPTVVGFSAVNNEGEPSHFIIRADVFAVANGDLANPKVPFIVQQDPTDGQYKVYMNSAMIKEASIDAAKIGKGIIEEATIGAANIDSGVIGGDIESASFSTTGGATSGWKLFSDGRAQFGKDVTFAGRLNVLGADSANGIFITNDRIEVRSNGQVRVRIGKL